MKKLLNVYEISERLKESGVSKHPGTIRDRHAKRSNFPAPFKPDVYKSPKVWLESDVLNYYGVD